MNHLYGLRQRADLASAILKAIDPQVAAAEVVDDGFVEFEFIGKTARLDERAFTRGANCTSVDAFMIGRLENGERRAFLIEWKYVETYAVRDLYVPARAKVYDYLIVAEDSPLKVLDPTDLYFEPFYQLMRQTLLGHLLTQHGDYGCKSYRHVHVVPRANIDFARRVTAPKLMGRTVSEAWRSVLRAPELFIDIAPEEMLRPVIFARDTAALISYLRRRYWAVP